MTTLRRRLAAALNPDPTPQSAPDPEPAPLVLDPCPGEGCTAHIALGALLARRDVAALLGQERLRYFTQEYGRARAWHREVAT